MNAKSVKRALGLAVAVASTGGAMTLAPAVANAATACPAHVQTASHVSQASNVADGVFGPGGLSFGLGFY